MFNPVPDIARQAIARDRRLARCGHEVPLPLLAMTRRKCGIERLGCHANLLQKLPHLRARHCQLDLGGPSEEVDGAEVATRDAICLAMPAPMLCIGAPTTIATADFSARRTPRSGAANGPVKRNTPCASIRYAKERSLHFFRSAASQAPNDQRA